MSNGLVKQAMICMFCAAVSKMKIKKLVKRTYIAFIDKASQDVDTVMVNYEDCLKPMKIYFSNIKSIMDKSDNTQCYHNQVLFSWKTHWSRLVLGKRFLETMFNEKQAGKGQRDWDSLIAKCHMNYYIDQDQNNESVMEMSKAFRTTTALYGFISSVVGRKRPTKTKTTSKKSAKCIV